MSTVAIPTPELVASPPYWQEARQPLASLVFLLPLLAIYELGVLWMAQGHPELVRNGADFWMRGWLQQLGFAHAWLLPVLVIGGLLIWQLAGRYPFRLSGETLLGMLAESLLFAFLLIIAGQLQDLAFHQLSLPTLAVDQRSLRVITFIGAGVYEEFLFRLCLLPVTFTVFRGLQFNTKWAAILSVLLTGLAFSAAHYWGAAGDDFEWFTFTFRLTAGLFFAALFFLRGFGITVGTHAAYDLVVGVVLFPR